MAERVPEQAWHLAFAVRCGQRPVAVLGREAKVRPPPAGDQARSPAVQVRCFLGLTLRGPLTPRVGKCFVRSKPERTKTSHFYFGGFSLLSWATGPCGRSSGRVGRGGGRLGLSDSCQSRGRVGRRRVRQGEWGPRDAPLPKAGPGEDVDTSTAIGIPVRVVTGVRGRAGGCGLVPGTLAVSGDTLLPLSGDSQHPAMHRTGPPPNKDDPVLASKLRNLPVLHQGQFLESPAL